MSDSYTPASYVPFSLPNAPHQQKCVFLHGPTCLDPDTLEHVATGLKKGDGDLVLILAPFCDGEPGSQDLEEVLAGMGLESKVPVSEKRWKKVVEAVGGTFHLTSTLNKHRHLMGMADKELIYHVIATSPSPELASAQDILVQSARIPYAESNLSVRKSAIIYNQWLMLSLFSYPTLPPSRASHRPRCAAFSLPPCPCRRYRHYTSSSALPSPSPHLPRPHLYRYPWVPPTMQPLLHHMEYLQWTSGARYGRPGTW